MARLLGAMRPRGYPYRQLKKKLESTLRLWPELYYKQRGGKIKPGTVASNILKIFEASHACLNFAPVFGSACMYVDFSV